MVEKFFNRIIVSEDKVGGIVSSGEYRVNLKRYNDDDFIKTPMVIIKANVPLPKCIKRVSEWVTSNGCNLVSFENIARICDRNVGVDVSVEENDTIEHLQKLIDLTSNSGMGNITVHVATDIRGELKFNTNGIFAIHGSDDRDIDLTISGKIGFLNVYLEKEKFRIDPNAEIRSFAYFGCEADIEEFIGYELLPDFDENLLERLQRLIGIDE